MTPRRSIIPIFVPHWGCPHQCVFCNQNRISGAQTPATVADVHDTLEEALSKLEPGREKTVAFYGGSFTAIPAGEQEALLAACGPYLERGDITDIRISTRPDAIDETVLARLRHFGVRTVELGVQSMDEEVLLLAGRGHTAKDAERAAKAVREAGFELILQMMTGLPGDTREKDLETAQRFIELEPDGVRIYPTVVIRGTPLYESWLSGSYREQTVEEAVEICAELSERYTAAGISIIRIGLNPTEALSAGEAVSGAYHPALGELVSSRVYLKKELSLLSEKDRGEEVSFTVAKGEVSKAVGHKGCNRRYLTESFGLRSVRFVEGNLTRGRVER